MRRKKLERERGNREHAGSDDGCLVGAKNSPVKTGNFGERDDGFKGSGTTSVMVMKPIPISSYSTSPASSPTITAFALTLKLSGNENFIS